MAVVKFEAEDINHVVQASFGKPRLLAELLDFLFLCVPPGSQGV